MNTNKEIAKAFAERFIQQVNAAGELSGKPVKVIMAGDDSFEVESMPKGYRKWIPFTSKLLCTCSGGKFFVFYDECYYQILCEHLPAGAVVEQRW